MSAWVVAASLTFAACTGSDTAALDGATANSPISQPSPMPIPTAVSPTSSPATLPPLSARSTPTSIPVRPQPLTPAPPPTSALPGATPATETVLRTAEVGGWDQLDPHLTASPTFFHFFGNVYSGLLRWEAESAPDGEVRRLVPDLAERWEQVDDRTYRFHLRRGARWHNLPPVNGRRVTAEDVAFNVRRLATASAHRSLWRRVATAREEGDDVVVIVLTEPYAPFLAQLAEGVNVLVAPEAVGAGGDLHEGPVIGTGPFVFDAAASHRLTRGVFLRNPAFYEPGLPRAEGLERTIVGSEEARRALLRAGRLDFLITDAAGAEALGDASTPELDLAAQPMLGGWALSLKPRPPFDQSEIRRAASQALDRAALWWTYSGTSLPVAVGLGLPLPSAGASLPAEESARAHAQDLASARAAVVAGGSPARTPFEVVIGDFGPRPLATGQELVRQLQAAGFAASARVVSAPFYTATVGAPPGLFHAAFGPVVAPPEADLWLSARFGTGGALNAIGAVDPRLEELILAQRRTGDREARAMLLLDLQRYLLEAAYQPMVFQEQVWAMWRPGLEGWPSAIDEPYQRFLRWVAPGSSAGAGG